MATIGLILLVIGKIQARKSHEILARGDFYRGQILKIKKLQCRVNGIHYFSIKICFDYDGKNITCNDVVYGDIVKHFEDIKQNPENPEVDLIYFPKFPSKAILPLKYIYEPLAKVHTKQT